MYDKGKIIPGLIVFVGLVALPVWYNAASGKPAGPPQLQMPEKSVVEAMDLPYACVEDLGTMRSSHMDLLNQWRDSAVRQNQHAYVNKAGREFRISLTGTCLGCHESKAQFCDACHAYAGITPTCWECHVDPREAAAP